LSDAIEAFAPGREVDGDDRGDEGIEELAELALLFVLLLLLLLLVVIEILRPIDGPNDRIIFPGSANSDVVAEEAEEAPRPRPELLCDIDSALLLLV
jgi:hypothetical protein